MRQELGSYEAFSPTITRALELDYNEALEKGRNSLKLTLEKSNYINIDYTFSMYTLPGLEAISYAYTRGDDLADIEKGLMTPSIPRILQTCDDIDELGLKGKEFFWGAAAGSVGEPIEYYMHAGQVLDVMVLMSYCLNFDVNEEEIKKFAPYLAPPGKSKIVDAVLSNFSDREVSSELGDYQQTDVGDALYEIYQASMEEKPTKIEAYLKNWLKLVSKKLDGMSTNTLGHYMRVHHKTKRTLVKDVELKDANGNDIVNPMYRGHWAWEIACLVKLQGIDDSSFRDHEWYPNDMVDYKSNNA